MPIVSCTSLSDLLSIHGVWRAWVIKGIKVIVVTPVYY